jgi:hypothetical protein
MPETVTHVAIVCHPAQDSFTRSVADTYAEAVRAHGQDVVLRDPYAIGFDPVLREEERQGQFEPDVAAEWDLIGDAQFIVLVYPVWTSSTSPMPQALTCRRSWPPCRASPFRPSPSVIRQEMKNMALSLCSSWKAPVPMPMFKSSLPMVGG